jgi:hypothetical protein
MDFTAIMIFNPFPFFPNEKRTISSDFSKMIDGLIIYGFTSRSRIFHLYGDVTNAGEWLQNLGLCLALRAFEQGSSSCHTCCDTGPQFFRSHPKDHPI